MRCLAATVRFDVEAIGMKRPLGLASWLGALGAASTFGARRRFSARRSDGMTT
ncbi:MAG: hypothetical protein QM817_05385 [Archangium sp.]